MVHAENYETVSTLVKVMQKKSWPLFFRTRCSMSINVECVISVDLIASSVLSFSLICRLFKSYLRLVRYPKSKPLDVASAGPGPFAGLMPLLSPNERCNALKNLVVLIALTISNAP